VSINTVLAAFALVSEQGYAIRIPHRGYVIARSERYIDFFAVDAQPTLEG